EFLKATFIARDVSPLRIKAPLPQLVTEFSDCLGCSVSDSPKRRDLVIFPALAARVDGAGADKTIAEQHSLQRGQKILGSTGLHHVTVGAGVHGHVDEVLGGVLRQKQYLSFGRQLQDLPSRFNSPQVGEADIEHDDVRLQLRCHLDRSQSSLHLTHNLDIGSSCERQNDKARPELVVVYDKNSNQTTCNPSNRPFGARALLLTALY